MSNSQLNSILNDSNLSTDPETEGFDLEAGKSWIYPTNFPVREYQYNIVQAALHKNTLVSLPTGLGKTFIAAVVMYNFYRWYPHGKLIFMAPTRPLVKQQIDACYNIMAIPPEVTAELTGTKQQTSRMDIWKEKRVFFITPQVLQNDLKNILELGPKIKCLVFDEAHKAKGNYAYCEVIRKLLLQTKLFRVLALSATPGNSLKDILEVMQNLLISHIEFRNEDSLDVKSYIFERSLETMVVKLDEKLEQVRDNYIQILEKYTRILIKYKVIQGNCCNLTKGKIFMTMKEFQEKNKNNRGPNYSEILKNLNICITLYHAYELLVRHGLRNFLSFFEEHIDKPLLRGNVSIINLMEDTKNYLGPAPNLEPLPDGSYSKISPKTKFGHPKFYQLRDILISHFTTNTTNSQSRVIVFFEYRESVMEAYALLLQSTPLIKPRVFLGQGSGITQKIQINVIKAFREGTCNVLLSTCIGEEGLDVGDVDLIVCFDISNKSPIRMIQRMGRTGRKRDGRIIILVTEGKEQQTLKDCLIQKNNLNNFILGSKELVKGIYNSCPVMIPNGIKPKCEKIFITVSKKSTILKKNSNLKDIFNRISNKSNALSSNYYDGDVEIVTYAEKLPKMRQQFWDKVNPLGIEINSNQNIFNKNFEKQRSLQTIGQVKHSKLSEGLVSLLQFADSKRFNLPMTQMICSTQQNKNLKQTDIRSMFLSNNTDDIWKIPETQTIFNNNNNKVKMNEISNKNLMELQSEVTNYLSITKLSSKNHCKICSELFKLPPKINNDENNQIIINNILNDCLIPDLTIIDTIEVDDLINFRKTLLIETNSNKNFEFDNAINGDDIFDNLELTQLEINNQKEQSFSYQAPKSFTKILQNIKNESNSQKEDNEKDLLSFFKLKSLDELFINSENKLETENLQNQRLVPVNNSRISIKLVKEKEINVKEREEEDEEIISTLADKTVIYSLSNDFEKEFSVSPDLFDDSEIKSPNIIPKSPEKKNNNNEEDDGGGGGGSPIFCSFERVQLLKSKTKKKLFEKSSNNLQIENKPNLSILKSPLVKCFDWKQNQFSTNLSNSISNFYEKIETNEDSNKIDLNISDFCDLSAFGLTTNNLNVDKTQNNFEKSPTSFQNDLNVVDLCDLSVFGLTNEEEENETRINNNDLLNQNINNISDLDDFCDLSVFNINDEMQKSFKETNQTKMNQNKSTNSKSQSTVTQILSLVSKSDEKSSPKNKKIKTISQTQIKRSNPLTNFNRTHLNLTINSDSGDEFETTSLDSSWIKPKPIRRAPRKSLSLKSPKLNRNKKKTRIRSDFIEYEAQLSPDENIFVSEDEEDNDDNDCYDASFVANETQEIMSTQMHVKYLESVRSPKNGRFKIPRRPTNNILNVFSQQVNDEDNSYVNDSFCINTEDINYSDHNSLSELELLEMKLNEKNRKKKRKKLNSSNSDDNKKRRRIIQISSDESD